MAYWARGDQVVERHIRQGALWGVSPKTVVCDGPDLLAVYTPPGTPQKRPYLLDGGSMRLLRGEEGWQLVDVPWSGEGLLTLMLPNAAHAVYCFWHPAVARSLSCWYINLQKAAHRWTRGYDTLDQTLDVVMTPDRASWEWKDDDELRQLQQWGLVTQSQAQMLRAEALRAVALLQAPDSPYRREWADWVPDPGWPVPTLPPDWDKIAE